MNEDDKKIMRDAFKEALLETGFSGNSKSKYSSDGGNGGNSGGGDGVSKSAQGDFVTGLGTMTGFVGKAGAKLGEVTGVLGDNVKGFQELSRTGASFNNNAIGMRDSIGQTRLSMDEYKGVMDKLSPSIAGLGGSVDKGTANFNKFSGEFMKTDFAEQLTKMGYTTKDLNDVMAANMANRRFTDLSDDLQRKKAIESTAALAREMDETAKLTGISRQEQVNDMKARSENGKVQAAIQLEVLRGGKDVEQQYNNMQAGLNGMGKGVKDLADEMFTGGVRTEEGAAKMAALGPAGQELEKAVNASKNAKTDEEKAAAKLQLDRAKAAVNERMKSEEFLQAVMTAGGRVGPAMQKMYEENKLRAGTTATETTTGKSSADAMAQNKQAAINQQQGKDEKGVKDEGAKTTELYIQGLNRTKDATAMAASAMNFLNNQLVSNAGAAVQKGLDLTKSRDKNGVQFADAGLEGVLNRSKELFGSGENKPITDKDGKPVDKDTQRREEVPGGSGGVGSLLIDPLIKVLSPLSNLFTKSLPVTMDAPRQATGSKDVFGDWFKQDWGTGGLSMLHGKEAVVPEAKIGEFIKDMMAQGGPSFMNLPAMPADQDLKSQKSAVPNLGTKATDIAQIQKDLIAKGAKIKNDGIMGPETENAMKMFGSIASKVSSATTATTDIKSSAAAMARDIGKEKKPEEAKLVPADASPAKKEEKQAIPGADATLSDLAKLLETLNTQMGQLVAHSAESVEHNAAAVKATKGLNGNLFAR